MQWKIGSVVLFVALAVSVFFNVQASDVYYKNYIDISPDHPNSEYRYLFPGLIEFEPTGIADMEQYLAHHFLLVVPNDSADFGEGELGIQAISRAGCRAFSGFGIAEGSIDLSEYVGKGILIKDFEETEGGLLVKDVVPDTFVNEHFEEYQEACEFPFNRYLD